jgi:glutamate--cysteine ligase
MQTISGIHYNFSIPETLWPILAEAKGQTLCQDFQTRSYFGLIRNFRRYSWLLIYLFGASPAVCKTFTKNLNHNLEDLGNGTLYLPHATSLRMGRLGYQSDAQGSLHVSYNSLENYAETIREALTKPYPAYEDIGFEEDGEYGQLNSSLIQIENEFHGTIRPKRRIASGERPLNSLLERGVEYVEVRCLDLSPFLRVGIDACQMRFLDTFLLYCLLAPSPDDSREESAQMISNQLTVVEQGRKPGLTLAKNSQTVSLEQWANTIIEQCGRVAKLIDAAESSDDHKYSVDLQAKKVSHPEHTPSARIIETMQTQSIPFYRFAMNQSIAHKGYFNEHPLTDEVSTEFMDEARHSLERQQEIEQSDTVDFSEFLQTYLQL